MITMTSRKVQSACNHFRVRERGFVLTIELMLIITVLIIGSFVGLVAIRDALVKRYVNEQSRESYVSDANGRMLGKAVDYDEHEAPRVPYIDRTAPAGADGIQRNYRALIGIRDDRFTSREAVYYENPDCTGIPCIKSPSNELADSKDVGGDVNSGVTGYIYALQGGPTYAIGRSPDGIQGYLYREAPQACPISPREIQSRYISQKVVTGSPCEPLTRNTGNSATAGAYVSDAYTDCLVGVDTSLGITNLCSCPDGFNDQGDILTNFTPQIDALLNTTVSSVNTTLSLSGISISTPDVGTLCCPAGSVLSDENLVETVVFNVLDYTLRQLNLAPTLLEPVLSIIEPLSGTPVCVDGSANSSGYGGGNLILRLAEPVPSAEDPAQNALEPFQAPFGVNLPADASEDNWYYIPPDGEG